MIAIFIILVAAAVSAAAAEPAPVALTGSDWLGIDGNWSSISLRVGQPSQNVNLLVSTALSEVWVIGTGGCMTNDPTCINARGGVFQSSSSDDWTAIGTWQLGLNYPGYEANGEYGQDKVSSHSSINDDDFSMDGVLVSALNTTNYFNGYFGLGIASGNFGDQVADPPMVQAVKKFGRIPSYTYGFTAGASYKNQPASLTLGGYDKARFVDHSTNFVLSQGDDLPHLLVRGIELSSDDPDSTPDAWEGSELGVASWNDSFTALIDSTTPYLWLPESVCEQLADNLNLTYDDNFDLYTLSNDKYNEYMNSEALSLTFSFSSIDNRDDFGDPLSAPGVVNISIPLKAFVGTLQYPFMGGASISYGDPAVPYFTLRKAPNNTTYVIGRSFLQEAYLVTQYDQRQFSVHQARFPKEPVRGAEIETIGQGSNSPYPGPATENEKQSSLSTGQIVGIVVGAVAALVLGIAAWFLFRRRRRARSPTPADSIDEAKGTGSSTISSPSSTPLAKFWSRLRGKSTMPPLDPEKTASTAPAEAAHGEIYELPAPVPPAELDGIDDSEMTGDTQLGLEGEDNLSPYEQTRRKLERQLQGPVPAYSPPENGYEPPPEKTMHDLPPPRPEHSSDGLLPVSPASGGTNSNSLPNSVPSPISPRTDSNGELTDIVSPVAAEAPPFPPFSAHGSNSPSVSPLYSSSQGHSNDQNSTARSNLDLPSPISPPPMTLPHQTTAIQRTPIDPSKVVFLGEMPEHVTFPRRTSLPRINLDNLNSIQPTEPQRTQQTSTLGSNYTEEQERATGLGQQERMTTSDRRTVLSQSDDSEPNTPRSQERIDPGEELVHVPQLAARRYSWEDSL